MKESHAWDTVQRLIVIMGFLATFFACVIGLVALLSPRTLTPVIVEIWGVPTPEPEVIIVTRQVSVVLEPTQSSNIPEPSSASTTPIPTISNIWDFDVHVNQGIQSDGFIRDTKDFFQLVVRLNQDGEILTGEYIGTTGTACGDARINGTIRGSDVNWTVEYRGNCCRGERMTFAGTMGADGNTMTGSLEPVGIPTTNCNLWFADLTATKR